MAVHIAVANRKGGVGKSTIAVMLAQGLAVWGGKRVLVIDLDSQCNASLILLGGSGWLDKSKRGATIADYFERQFIAGPVAHMPRDYIVHEVGDVLDRKGRPPPLAILPGSLLLEDVQYELFMRQSRQGKTPEAIVSRVCGRMAQLLRPFDKDFDVVITDCPPGLSFAARSALNTAGKVVVPFRPDYVSQFAIDRISQLIEDKLRFQDVLAIPHQERRYVTVANYVQPGGRDRIQIEEIADLHPTLRTQLPLSPAIAEAFYWRDQKRSIEEKYGAGVEHVLRLYDELAGRLGL